MTAERRGQAIPSSKPHRAWLRFQRLPAAYSHPERIARLLPDGLPTGFADRLQASPRLGLRLSAALTERLAFAPCAMEDLATPEGRFALLEGEALQSALRRVGAIWHARSIKRIILAEPLRRLIARLGRENHAAALRHAELAPKDAAAPAAATGADDVDVDMLMGLIERDGLIAVNAWCCHQPKALAQRLRLKLPPCPESDDAPPESHREQGVLIVDRVAMSLAARTDRRLECGDPGHG